MTMRDLIRDLQLAHAQLREIMLIVAVEVGKSAPDMSGLSSARLNLTRVSRRRALLIEQIIQSLPVERRGPLAVIQQDLQKARMASADHIGRWTVSSIEKDWQAYRVASANIREAMSDQIEREAKAVSAISH